MIRIEAQPWHGIYLPEMRIVFDGGHPDAEYAIISHAHSDHAPKGKRIPVISTPLTAKLLRARGFSGEILELDFHEPLELHSCRLTLFQAGHISGSAMIYVESDNGTLLYTGDFKNPPSPVSEGFTHPEKAEILISEATFSLPIYRWKSHDILFEQVRTFALESLYAGETPVFQAYSLGKTQELLHALAPLGLTTQVHASAFQLSQIIAETGFDLGLFESQNLKNLAGKPLIVPGGGSVPDLPKIKLAYVSGWAAHEAVRQQQQIDERIVLSDHADFFAVVDFVKAVKPKKTFITHSPFPDIVCHWLKKDGFDAEPLGITREQGAE